MALGASALLVWLGRGVFLFWDDFVFLSDAQRSGLSWDYLTSPLFTHFSPVVRLINWAVVGALPGHPWVIRWTLAVLLTATACAATWLFVVLFGRSRTALLGSLLAAPSLTLVPLGTWWTAGVNILPALTAFMVAFGALVLVVGGHSRWWALPCLLGAAVGVLDYELPILLPAYLGLWLLLCGHRVTAEPWWAVLRRTWWLWLGVAAIAAAALVNYRVNYYSPQPSPPPGALAHALGRSLLRTLLPTGLGFHDPRSHAFSALSLVLGWLVLVGLVGWLLRTRAGAWRGLLFAAAGWLVPTVALVLNRYEIYGVVVVDNAIYFFLPTVLTLVGVLEASRAPRRAPAPSAVGGRRWPAGVGTAVPVTAAVVVVAGYAWSAGPTARYQLPPGADASFADRARSSAAALPGPHPANVVDSDVPYVVVPPTFVGYDRASRVLPLVADTRLVFDRPRPPYYRLDATGDLRPVRVVWLDRTDVVPVDHGPVQVRQGRNLEAAAGGGACFTTTKGTRVAWTLPAALVRDDLVVRTEWTVSRATPAVLAVLPIGTNDYVRANHDGHRWVSGGGGQLDTLETSSARALRLHDFEPGVRVCVRTLSVGQVRPAS